MISGTKITLPIGLLTLLSTVAIVLLSAFPVAAQILDTYSFPEWPTISESDAGGVQLLSKPAANEKFMIGKRIRIEPYLLPGKEKGPVHYYLMPKNQNAGKCFAKRAWHPGSFCANGQAQAILNERTLLIEKYLDGSSLTPGDYSLLVTRANEDELSLPSGSNIVAKSEVFSIVANPVKPGMVKGRFFTEGPFTAEEKQKISDGLVVRLWHAGRYYNNYLKIEYQKLQSDGSYAVAVAPGECAIETQSGQSFDPNKPTEDLCFSQDKPNIFVKVPSVRKTFDVPNGKTVNMNIVIERVPAKDLPEKKAFILRYQETEPDPKKRQILVPSCQ